MSTPADGKTPNTHDAALAVRREVLGAEYVDRQTGSDDPRDAEFQRFVIDNCWGTSWTDERLTRQQRSLITLAVTATLGRLDEFKLHVLGAYNNGLTRDELESFCVQIGVYAGVPAALGARKALVTVAQPPERS